MDNGISADDIQKILGDFYKGTVKVYEAGRDETRPERLQDRPFFNLLPHSGEQAAYMDMDRGGKGADYNLSFGGPGTSGTLETRHHAFINEMQERFSAVKPQATIVIIDPDVIRGRYAGDERQGRSIQNTLAEYLQEKLVMTGKIDSFPHEEFNADITEASVYGNEPASISVKENQSAENLKGDGQVAVVIASNPDKPMHHIFSSVPGVFQRVELENISRKAMERAILYHELGHALDLSESGIPGASPNTRLTADRHRSESVADVHSVLQIAKEEGNTAFGEMLADVRSHNVMMDMAQTMQSFRMTSPLEDDEKTDGANVQQIKAQMHKIYQGAHMTPEEVQAIREKDLATTPEGMVLQNMEMSAMAYRHAQEFSTSAAYNTVPVIDAAVLWASKALQDGSLKKMTDREIHKQAESLTQENMWSQEKLDRFSLAVLTGKADNEEIRSIQKRFEITMVRMPEIQQAQIAMSMGGLALDPVMMRLRQGVSPQEQQEAIIWRRHFLEQVGARGGKIEHIIAQAAKEKDALRGQDMQDPAVLYKLQILNEEMLGQAPESLKSANAIHSVKKSIKNVDKGVMATDMSGEQALAAFIENSVIQADKMMAFVKMSEGRHADKMPPIEYAKALTKEAKALDNMFGIERKSQALAFHVRKDKKVWADLQQTPGLATVIDMKAKRKHSDFLDVCQLNLEENRKDRMQFVLYGAASEKGAFAQMAVKYPPIINALNKYKPELLKKLTADAAEMMRAMEERQAAQHEQAQKSSGKSGAVIWHRSPKPFKGRGSR